MTVKICCISDTHNKHEELDIEPCDILLHAGDLTSRGSKHDSLNAIEWLEGLHQATFKVFIAGNHELGWDSDPKPGWLQDKLGSLKNNTYYLEDSMVNVMGINIYGTPWQPEFFNWAFNLQRGGGQLREKYAMIPDSADILITHGPPYGIFDEIPLGYLKPWEKDWHVGCKDLLQRMDSLTSLQYAVFGHIHLDGRREIGCQTTKPGGAGVKCINAAVVDNHYDVIVKPYYFNYEV